MTPLHYASCGWPGWRDRDLADLFRRQGRVALLRHGPVVDRVEAHRFARFGVEREGVAQFAGGAGSRPRQLPQDRCRWHHLCRNLRMALAGVERSLQRSRQ